MGYASGGLCTCAHPAALICARHRCPLPPPPRRGERNNPSPTSQSPDYSCLTSPTSSPLPQCGRFHGVEVFDAQYRSCRYSLARHQERRKRRHAEVAALGKKRKQVARRQERQSLPGETTSQLSKAESQAQLRSEPLPLPLPLPAPLPQPEQAQQAAAPKPAKQAQRRQAGAKKQGARAKQAAAASAASASEAQLPAEQEQRLMHAHSGKRPRQSPPPTVPQAASEEHARQPQHSNPAQPATPPGLRNIRVASMARGQPSTDALPVCTTPTYAVAAAPPPPPQRSLWPLLQQAAEVPASPVRGQQQPAVPVDAAWGQQAAPPPASPAWGQQLPAAPASAVWGQQPPAAPDSAAWSQQPSERNWLVIIGDQRLAPAQPGQLPPQVLLPAAAREAQQPGGQAHWPTQQVQHARSGSGGCSGSTTYYPCYGRAATAQELLHMCTPIAQEQLPGSPYVEVAACSTSAPAAPLSPHMASTPPSLPLCGSAAASTYTAVASPLSPTCGGGGGTSPGWTSPYYGAGPAAPPGTPAFWPAVSLPAAATPPSVPMLPVVYSGSSNALNQGWAQLAWQEEQQLTPRSATTPHAAGLPFSPQPCQLPSLSPCQLPSPRAAPPPGLLLSRLPSLPSLLPQAALDARQAPLWQPLQAQHPQQQQQAQPQSQCCWDADWADEALIASPMECPPSPAVSWLKDF